MRRVCLTLPTNRAATATVAAMLDEAAYAVDAFDVAVHLLILDSSEEADHAAHAAVLHAAATSRNVVVWHLDERRQRDFLLRVIDAAGVRKPDLMLDLMLPAELSYGACTNRAFLIASALGCESVHRRDSDSRYQTFNDTKVFPIHHELMSLGRTAAAAADGVTETDLDAGLSQRPVVLVGGSFVGELSVDIGEIQRIDPDVYHDVVSLWAPGDWTDEQKRELVDESFRGAGTEPFDGDHSVLTVVDPMRVDMCNVAFHRVHEEIPLPPAVNTIGSDYFLLHLVHAAKLPGVLHNRDIENFYTPERRTDSGFERYQLRLAKFFLSMLYLHEVYRRMADAGDALLAEDGRVRVAVIADLVHDSTALDQGRERPPAGRPRRRLPETRRPVRGVRRHRRGVAAAAARRGTAGHGGLRVADRVMGPPGPGEQDNARRRLATVTPVGERLLAALASATHDQIVYDLPGIVQRHDTLLDELPGIAVRFAMKACPVDEVLACLADRGAGFDAAGPHEMTLAALAGAPMDKVHYGNTIKSDRNIAEAYGLGIRDFATDSVEDVAAIAANAPGSRVFCRLATTGDGALWGLSHKCGCSGADAVRVLETARALGLRPAGLSVHVGSQQMTARAWWRAFDDLADVIVALADRGIHLDHVNLGGGLPALGYLDHDGRPLRPRLDHIFATIRAGMRRLGQVSRSHLEFRMEPGRHLVADQGAIRAHVARVSSRQLVGGERQYWLYLSCGKFNGLYEMDQVQYRLVFPSAGDADRVPAVIAGPTCDSDDAYDRTRGLVQVPRTAASGDPVWILSCGAYAMSYMTVGFNGFPPLPYTLTTAPVEQVA